MTHFHTAMTTAPNGSPDTMEMDKVNDAHINVCLRGPIRSASA